MALSVESQELDRVSRDRPWAVPRRRDVLLVVAAILAVAGAVVQSLDTEARGRVVLIGRIEAGDLVWVLLCLATVMLLLWSLARCWLRPGWRFASTAVRVAITVPLVWLLFLASMGAVLGAAFASGRDFVRVGADDQGEYVLMVEPRELLDHQVLRSSSRSTTGLRSGGLDTPLVPRELLDHQALQSSSRRAARPPGCGGGLDTPLVPRELLDHRVSQSSGRRAARPPGCGGGLDTPLVPRELLEHQVLQSSSRRAARPPGVR